MTATGRAALALDALFTITDPAARAAARQAVDALIEQAPLGLVDQATAAGLCESCKPPGNHRDPGRPARTGGAGRPATHPGRHRDAGPTERTTAR